MKQDKRKTHTCPCWNCGQGVPLASLGEVCSYCGASLTSFDYDWAATMLLQELAQIDIEAKERKTALAAFEKRWEKLKRSHRIIAWLVSRVWSKRYSALKNEHGQSAKQRRAKKKKLGKYAEAHYYASQWFKSMKIMLASSGEVDSPFRRARYDDHGNHFLEIDHTSDARGLLGEYLVYDLLSSAIESGELAEAALIPDLYLPVQHGSYGHFVDRAYTEIDCVLVTRRAIYVIEVKNLYGHVSGVYKRKAQEYRVYFEPAHKGALRSNRPRVEDRGPEQNERHREAFISAIECPKNSTFNIVSYINNFGFVPPKKQGVKNTYLTTDKGETDANILEVIKRIESALPVIRSKDEVKALSYELMYRFRDDDGSKKIDHQERLHKESRARKVCYPKLRAC